MCVLVTLGLCVGRVVGGGEGLESHLPRVGGVTLHCLLYYSSEIREEWRAERAVFPLSDWAAGLTQCGDVPVLGQDGRADVCYFGAIWEVGGEFLATDTADIHSGPVRPEANFN